MIEASLDGLALVCCLQSGSSRYATEKQGYCEIWFEKERISCVWVVGGEASNGFGSRLK